MELFPGYVPWVHSLGWSVCIHTHTYMDTSSKKRENVRTGSHFPLLMKTVFSWRRGSSTNVSVRVLQNGVILPRRKIANLEKSILKSKSFYKCLHREQYHNASKTTSGLK